MSSNSLPQSVYIHLAPGFVKEVLEMYDNWEGRDAAPNRVKELMMVLQIEVDRLYKPDERARIAALPKEPLYKDTRLK